MSWLLTALLAVGPDLLVRLVLVDVNGDPLVAVLGDLLLQRGAATQCMLVSWLLTGLLAVGPDLFIRLVLVDVDGDPLVAVLGDLLLQRVLQLSVCW